jgi:hypothetical protein
MARCLTLFRTKKSCNEILLEEVRTADNEVKYGVALGNGRKVVAVDLKLWVEKLVMNLLEMSESLTLKSSSMSSEEPKFEFPCASEQATKSNNRILASARLS